MFPQPEIEMPDSFGLVKKTASFLKTDHSHKLLGFYLGLGAIVLFLGIVSLAPQIGEKLGKLATKKESQQSFAATKSPPCDGYGDADGDGFVSIGDAQKISMFVNGESTDVNFDDPAVRKRADVDGDRRVAIGDAQRIGRYVIDLDITFPMCVDHDMDGFVDGVENYLGTDPYKSCGGGSPSKSWPADLVNSGISANKINIADMSSYTVPIQRINTSPGDPGYDKRWDLVPGSVAGKEINISDLSFLSMFTAPMFNGQKAWNGPACTIADPPSVSLSVSPSSILAGEAVTISWSSSGAVAPCDASSDPSVNNWQGQKQLSSGSNPPVQSLAQAGIYTFTLTCYGPGGLRADAKTVTVTPPPTPTPTPTPLPCTGNPTLLLSTTSVTQGGLVRATASGVSNCTGADEIDFKMSTDGSQSWNVDLGSCRLTSNNSCYKDFGTANINPGQYPIIAFLDAGADGGAPQGSSNQITLEIKTQAVSHNSPSGWPTIGTVNAVHFPSFGDYTTWPAVDVLYNSSLGDSRIFATMDGTVTVNPGNSTCGPYPIDIVSSTNMKVHYCHLINLKITSGPITFGTYMGDMSNEGDTEGIGAVQVHYAICTGFNSNGTCNTTAAQMAPPYLPFAPPGIANSLTDSSPN